MKNLQEKDFSERLESSGIMTDMAMKYLVKIGHILAFRKASLDEDKNQGIDYWVDFIERQNVPIQFKVRIKEGYCDIPVVRYQPFYGVDDTRTVIGRDYRGLVSGVTEYYYVLVTHNDKTSEIYRAKKEILKDVLLKMDAAWAIPDRCRPLCFHHDKMTFKVDQQFLQKYCDSSGRGVNQIYCPDENDSISWQIWWHKNNSERYSKINYYLPHSLKESGWVVPSHIYSKMREQSEKYIEKSES